MKTKPADAQVRSPCAVLRTNSAWPSAIYCFLRGTTIRTADGDKKIEDLAVGDLLPAVFGGMRPVQWIGRYPFKKSDPTKAWVKMYFLFVSLDRLLVPMCRMPICFVTKAHALLIDGVLVPVCNLINGHDDCPL